MVDVETVQLAVGGQIDARLTLNIEYDARGIEDRLLAAAGRDGTPSSGARAVASFGLRSQAGERSGNTKTERASGDWVMAATS